MITFSSYGGEIKLPSEFKKEGNVYIYGEEKHKRVKVESYVGDFELSFKGE